MEKLSRQVGTSVAVLRKTYVHQRFQPSEWSDIHTSSHSKKPSARILS